MSPLPIVEELEVLDERGARRRPRGPGRVVDQLDLQRREEALGDGIVPAIAPAAHAADDAVPFQGPLVVTARVLTSPIRMMQQALGWPPTRQGHAEGTKRQVIGD